MKIIRTYKFRLKPNAEQEAKLNAACAAVRMVYNAANEQRIMYGRRQGTDAHGRNSFFNKNRQAKELGFRSCKAESSWSVEQVFKDVNGNSRHSLSYRASSMAITDGLKGDPELGWMCDLVFGAAFSYALDSLDQAWDKFYKNVTDGTAKKLPSYRNARDDNSIKLRAYANGKPFIVFGEDRVKVPKIGHIRYVKHMRLRRLTLHDSTIVKEGDKWYICVPTSREVSEPVITDPAYAGIDLGTVEPVVVADTNGDIIPVEAAKELKTSGNLSKRIKRLQREASRARQQNRGKNTSNRQKRRYDEIARLHRKEAARKRLGLHQITTELVNTYTHIGIENLSGQRMTESGKTRRKKGKAQTSNKVQAAYNRAFLDVPKYMFRAQLEYKAAGLGRHVLAIDPAYTSKTCSACGHVSNFSRTKAVQEKFTCPSCGNRENADANAAKNILKTAFPNYKLGLSGAVAGPRKTPAKTRNSEKCKSSELAPVQTPAASNHVVSPNEGRGGTSFLDTNSGESAAETDGSKHIGCG